MSEVCITLDPLNPAQFLACCGLFELLGRQRPDVPTQFQYDPFTPSRATFAVSGMDMGEVLAGLAAVKTARVNAVPDFSGGEAPVRMVLADGGSIELDWWLVPTRTDKSPFKLWAGQQTTTKLVQDMRDALPDALDERLLDFRSPMSGRFGFDPRSAWTALDFGSSPNTQGRDAYTYPVTELLAAVGLQGFRLRQIGRREYAYWLWTVPLPLVAARAAGGGALAEARGPAFRFEIVKRNKSYSAFTYGQPLQE
ncbi:MAG TPA: hypothetical protein VF579_11905 [Candidatus Methylomirabilis sp.]